MDTKGSIEVLPSHVVDALRAHDIDASDIKVSVKSDMTLDNVYMDSWVFITGERLVLMDGLVHKSGKKKGKKAAEINENWEEKSYTEYPITEFKDFKVEILPATNIITANRNGDDFVVCKFTNTLGKKMRAFTELANKVVEGKEITEEDLAGHDIESSYCPKCGKLYRNQEEKICIHCIDRKKVFFRLLNYGSQYKWYMVAIVIFILISSGLALLYPYLGNKIFYDEILSESGKYYGKVVMLVGLILCLRLVSLLVTVLYGRINAFLSNHIVFNLRNDVFKSMQDLSISFFIHKQTGSLMTRVDRDSEHVQWFFLDGVPYLIVNFINIVGVSLLMISIRPVLSLLVLIPAPFIFIFFRRWLPKFYKLFGRSHKRRSAMNARMNDSFMGLKVVKAFGKEDKENEDFSRSSNRFSVANMHIGITSSTVFPVVSFLMWMGSLAIYIFGGLLIIEGKLLFGDIATLVGYVGMIYGPMQWFARLVSFWSRAMNSANRIFEVIDAEPEVKEKKDPVRKMEFNGDVKIDNVSFSYEPNRMVLKNVSVDVKAGENIGVVGHSGAGKSTLVNLITRLYDVDSGGIYIDGINIKDLSIEDLKSQIGIVLQDTYLFMGTIAENIAYGKPDATMTEIIKAAKAAYAHEFIMNTPDGYDTRIGTGGHGLSGGERQRVSLARAMLKNPRILILDEATSAIDTQTESQIQKALEKLAEGRTTFNIAHRLSTLRNADRLIVLDNGEIVEMGTHEEVYAQEGVYHKLYHIQKEALKLRGIND